MAWKFHTGFEDQELTSIFPADTDNTPEISAANPKSGGYHLRVPFFSNDAYGFSRDDDFLADDADSGYTAGLSIAFNELDKFEGDFRFGIYVDTNSTATFAGFSIDVTTGVIRAGAANDSNMVDVVHWASDPGQLVEGEYLDLEIWYHAHNSNGGWKFGVNGVEVYSETGIDTNQGAGTPTTGWGLTFWVDGKNAVSGHSFDMDDLRFGDGFAGLRGMVEHEWLAPDSTLESDGTPSAGGDHHLLVDEVPFSDTDYVDLDVVADRERFGLADRTLTGDVEAVTVTCQAQQPSGSSTANTFLESSTTEEAGDSLVLGAGAQVFRQIVENDPNTAAPWTTAGVNAATVGMERTA